MVYGLEYLSLGFRVLRVQGQGYLALGNGLGFRV
jgi:hypothetical protein